MSSRKLRFRGLMQNEDLFQATLASDKLEALKKTKNLAWMETADLRLVNTEQELQDILVELAAHDGPIAWDTETTGLRIKEDKIVGLSGAWRRKENGKICAFYVPLISDVDVVGISPYRTLSLLKPFIESFKSVFYHFKFDYKMLKAAGINAGLLADVQLMKLMVKGGLDELEFGRVKKMSLKAT